MHELDDERTAGNASLFLSRVYHFQGKAQGAWSLVNNCLALDFSVLYFGSQLIFHPPFFPSI